MPADTVLSRELKSLQNEIATSQRARACSPADRAMASNATPVSQAPVAADKQAINEEEGLPGEFREFVDEATRFFDEAEKNIAAHPAASMVGALVVGMLIGRLLAR